MKVDIHTLHQAGAISPLAFYFADTMGAIAKETDPLALLGAAVALEHTYAGHVCADLLALAGAPIETADPERVLEATFPEAGAWLAALERSPLVSDGTRPTPLVLDSAGLLYLTRYWRFQELLAQALTAHAADAADDLDRPTLDGVLDRLFGPANVGATSPERQAAFTALSRGLTLITGGPGTGKTTLVTKIMAAHIMVALETGRPAPLIMALAPTGKAAARLEEALGRAFRTAPLMELPAAVLEALPKSAGTIHRALLRARGAPRFRRREAEALLPADLVVVDEASMVDLGTMHALLDVLKKSARLIVMGDKDQLASVESGAVMADLHDAAKVPGSPLAASLTTLTRSHRFDAESGIGRLAEAINRGDAESALRALRDEADPETTLIEVTSAAVLQEALQALMRQHTTPALLEPDPEARRARLGDLAVLCAHRQGWLGQEGLNRSMEEILAGQGVIRPEREWYAGRPIMVTRNDYPTRLYNGDVGLIVPSPENPNALVALFTDQEGAPRHIALSRLPRCETVFAMTIHKSQGSEFDRVAVVLPERRSNVVTRELLYTACTRARRQVLFLGTAQVIREAVETPTRRASGLKERLAATVK